MHSAKAVFRYIVIRMLIIAQVIWLPVHLLCFGSQKIRCQYTMIMLPVTMIKLPITLIRVPVTVFRKSTVLAEMRPLTLEPHQVHPEHTPNSQSLYPSSLSLEPQQHHL